MTGKQLSRVNIGLVVFLVIVTAVLFVSLRDNAAAREERDRMNSRLSAVELNLKEARQGLPDIEVLKKRLAEAKAAVVSESPLPGHGEATTFTDQLMRAAVANSITINQWDTAYFDTAIAGKGYPAISHEMAVQGGSGDLIGFVGNLAQGRIRPVLEAVDIARAKDKEGSWDLKLRLMVYFR
ncbi:MAG: hypothetical protein HYX91_04770 [Chloroflexi bacterium]|nr:hypothetical protein [Chloroflexota bacterium]